MTASQAPSGEPSHRRALVLALAALLAVMGLMTFGGRPTPDVDVPTPERPPSAEQPARRIVRPPTDTDPPVPAMDAVNDALAVFARANGWYRIECALPAGTPEPTGGWRGSGLARVEVERGVLRGVSLRAHGSFMAEHLDPDAVVPDCALYDPNDPTCHRDALDARSTGTRMLGQVSWSDASIDAVTPCAFEPIREVPFAGRFVLADGGSFADADLRVAPVACAWLHVDADGGFRGARPDGWTPCALLVTDQDGSTLAMEQPSELPPPHDELEIVVDPRNPLNRPTFSPPEPAVQDEILAMMAEAHREELAPYENALALDLPEATRAVIEGWKQELDQLHQEQIRRVGQRDAR